MRLNNKGLVMSAGQPSVISIMSRPLAAGRPASNEADTVPNNRIAQSREFKTCEHHNKKKVMITQEPLATNVLWPSVTNSI